MSFSRLSYDNCTYTHMLRESVGPGEYSIATPKVDCESCYFPTPDIRMTRRGVGKSKDLVDIDSELIGITRKASNCPLNKFLPVKEENQNINLGKDCMHLTTEETRISNPPCTLRGTGWNRWEWLCQNPQDKIFIPFDFNINERMIAKDNHRPIIQQPIDQQGSLPPIEYNEFSLGYKPSCTSTQNEFITGPSWASCKKIQFM